MTFQLAFHFTMLVDALDQGNYTNTWKESVVDAFLAFRQQVIAARHHHRETRESLPHHERFGRLMSGSGSDTAEVIRLRHAFMLSEIYPKIKVIPKDPNRCFDALERELIWNRDRGQCQNPECSRPERKVSFRDAHLHHIQEHCSGGGTSLRNGILICPECHVNRADMQTKMAYFQDYITRIYNSPSRASEVSNSEDFDIEDSDDNETIGKEGLQIIIDWGELDIDRPTETIRKSNDISTIVALLKLLLEQFGKPMRDQLTEMPIVRFPLSSKPMQDFMNSAKGRPYSYAPIPGTDLYFCGHSSRSQKADRLRSLISRLTLPDGSEFPESVIMVSLVSNGDG